MGTSFENLRNMVVKYSVSSTWSDAVLEWELIDTEEDEEAESRCICGKENIRYLHKIQNVHNKNILFPIGSTCIKKFNRSDLNEQISVEEKMFKLCHAVDNNEFLSMTTELFSRKLINKLYEEGAFRSSSGPYDEMTTYTFFLKMFNKRNKEDITTKQQKMITAIILNCIKPFIIKRNKAKIINSK